MHNYGIKISKSVGHAYETDKKNTDTSQRDAIYRDIQNVGIYFEIQLCDCCVSVVWKKVTGHMAFNVNMDFTRKARWVLDWQRDAYPEGSQYNRVVSRGSISIERTYTALSGLNVVVADKRNAYLQVT